MTIEQDILREEVTNAYIELFQIDCAAIPALATTVYYLTPSSGTPITWNGKSYTPWAIALDNLNFISDGAPLRPNLSIGNLDVNKLIGMLVFGYNDIVGAKVTYIRTFENYLNTAISLPPLKFVVGKKTAHSHQLISFELRSPLDKERGYLPNRQILKSAFPGIATNKIFYR